MMTTAPVIVDDPGFNSAVAVSAPEFSCPIPGSNQPYMLTQDWECWNASWLATPLGTIHPDSATFQAKWGGTAFYLTAESARLDLGGGMVKWKRTYCQIPVTRFDYSSMSFQFPGLIGLTGSGSTVYTIRTPVTKPSPCQIQYDYYQVGTLNASYASAGSIPLIAQTRFGIPQMNGSSFIGLQDVGILTPSGGAGVVTLPASDEYLANPPMAIRNYPATYNPTWYGNGVTLYPIVVQCSELSRWQGNIYERITKFVQAL